MIGFMETSVNLKQKLSFVLLIFQEHSLFVSVANLVVSLFLKALLKELLNIVELPGMPMELLYLDKNQQEPWKS